MLPEIIIDILIATLNAVKEDIELTIKISDDKTAIHHLPKTIEKIDKMIAGVNEELEKLKNS